MCIRDSCWCDRRAALSRKLTSTLKALRPHPPPENKRFMNAIWHFAAAPRRASSGLVDISTRVCWPRPHKKPSAAWNFMRPHTRGQQLLFTQAAREGPDLEPQFHSGGCGTATAECPVGEIRTGCVEDIRSDERCAEAQLQQELSATVSASIVQGHPTPSTVGGRASDSMPSPPNASTSAFPRACDHAQVQQPRLQENTAEKVTMHPLATRSLEQQADFCGSFCSEKMGRGWLGQSARATAASQRLLQDIWDVHHGDEAMYLEIMLPFHKLDEVTIFRVHCFVSSCLWAHRHSRACG